MIFTYTAEPKSTFILIYLYYIIQDNDILYKLHIYFEKNFRNNTIKFLQVLQSNYQTLCNLVFSLWNLSVSKSRK